MALLSMRERAGALALLEEVRVCRALRPRRLQRPVRRAAAVPGLRPGAIRSRRAAVRSGHRLRGARRPHPRDRRAPRLADRAALPAVAAAQPSRQDRARPPSGWPASCRRAGCGWRSATPTAAAMAHSTSCASGSACAACPGCTATTCWPGRTGCGRCSPREPGTYLLTDFLVRSFRRSVLAELGPGSGTRAVARLLRPLPAGGLAGAVP